MSTPIVTVVIPHFVAFDSGQKSAAIAVFTFALLSTIVLSSVLLSVVWIVFSSIFKRTSCEDLTREAFFFRSQLGQYAVCLLFSNWLSSVSGLMDIEWINGGGVTAGPSCSAQGALSQIGEFGSSFFTITMGIHTFNTLVLRNRQPQWVGIVVTLLGWVAALVIGLGPVSISDRASGPLYNISGFTCGFSKSYQVAHMLLYFLPRFLASFLSVVVFSLIFLMLRGTITINGGLKIQFDPERRLRPRNETFEEYQRFIYSVARKMLWLPITFVLALFPSSIVHLMDISGIAVSSGAMAFSYIFQYLDGVFNVLVLFNVLKALGPAMRMRSTNTNVTSDTEKGDSEKRNVSRPTYDWKPQSTFAPSSQGPVMKTAPPARPPGSILQEYVPQSSSLRESLRQSHKKTGSVGSFTRLLTPEPLSRAHSPSGSIDSHLSVLTALNPQPIVPASVLDAGLLPPPEAVQKHTQTVPQLYLLPSASASFHGDLNVTGLTPSPRQKRSRVSSDLSPIAGSPAAASVPQSAASLLEVTLHSPVTDDSTLTDGVGSLISMYFSRKSTLSAELPPFPAAAVARDSSIELPLSGVQSSVPTTLPLPAESSPDLPVVVPPEVVIRPLRPNISLGAVRSGQGNMNLSAAPPNSPPMPLVSPDDSSHYSDSEAGTPPPPPQERPRVRLDLQPTQPLRPGKVAQERLSSEQPQSLRSSQDRPALRALPIPPARPAMARTASTYSLPSSSISIHSRQGSSSSSRLGYL